jgi:hypothetical protein
MKALRYYTYTLLLIGTLVSCEQNDDPAPAQAPSNFAYTNATAEAKFYEDGNSTAPNVNWNGDEGTFSLATSVTGISIDAATGVLSWTKALPLGEHQVQVLAKNSQGQVSTAYTLTNLPAAQFEGDYNFDPNAESPGTDNYYVFSLKQDGTMTGSLDEDELAGTWQLNADGSISGTYTYTGFGDSYDFTANVQHSETAEPLMVGKWKRAGQSYYDGSMKLRYKSSN